MSQITISDRYYFPLRRLNDQLGNMAQKWLQTTKITEVCRSSLEHLRKSLIALDASEKNQAFFNRSIQEAGAIPVSTYKAAAAFQILSHTNDLETSKQLVDSIQDPLLHDQALLSLMDKALLQKHPERALSYAKDLLSYSARVVFMDSCLKTHEKSFYKKITSSPNATSRSDIERILRKEDLTFDDILSHLRTHRFASNPKAANALLLSSLHSLYSKEPARMLDLVLHWQDQQTKEVGLLYIVQQKLQVDDFSEVDALLSHICDPVLQEVAISDLLCAYAKKGNAPRIQTLLEKIASPHMRLFHIEFMIHEMSIKGPQKNWQPVLEIAQTYLADRPGYPQEILCRSLARTHSFNQAIERIGPPLDAIAQDRVWQEIAIQRANQGNTKDAFLAVQSIRSTARQEIALRLMIDTVLDRRITDPCSFEEKAIKSLSLRHWILSLEIAQELPLTRRLLAAEWKEMQSLVSSLSDQTLADDLSIYSTADYLHQTGRSKEALEISHYILDPSVRERAYVLIAKTLLSHKDPDQTAQMLPLLKSCLDSPKLKALFAANDLVCGTFNTLDPSLQLQELCTHLLSLPNKNGSSEEWVDNYFKEVAVLPIARLQALSAILYAAEITDNPSLLKTAIQQACLLELPPKTFLNLLESCKDFHGILKYTISFLVEEKENDRLAIELIHAYGDADASLITPLFDSYNFAKNCSTQEIIELISLISDPILFDTEVFPFLIECVKIGEIPCALNVFDSLPDDPLREELHSQDLNTIKDFLIQHPWKKILSIQIVLDTLQQKGYEEALTLVDHTPAPNLCKIRIADQLLVYSDFENALKVVDSMTNSIMRSQALIWMAKQALYQNNPVNMFRYIEYIPQNEQQKVLEKLIRIESKRSWVHVEIIDQLFLKWIQLPHDNLEEDIRNFTSKIRHDRTLLSFAYALFTQSGIASALLAFRDSSVDSKMSILQTFADLIHSEDRDLFAISTEFENLGRWDLAKQYATRIQDRHLQDTKLLQIFAHEKEHELIDGAFTTICCMQNPAQQMTALKELSPLIPASAETFYEPYKQLIFSCAQMGYYEEANKCIQMLAFRKWKSSLYEIIQKPRTLYLQKLLQDNQNADPQTIPSLLQKVLPYINDSLWVQAVSLFKQLAEHDLQTALDLVRWIPKEHLRKKMTEEIKESFLSQLYTIQREEEQAERLFQIAPTLDISSYEKIQPLLHRIRFSISLSCISQIQDDELKKTALRDIVSHISLKIKRPLEKYVSTLGDLRIQTMYCIELLKEQDPLPVLCTLAKERLIPLVIEIIHNLPITPRQQNQHLGVVALVMARNGNTSEEITPIIESIDMEDIRRQAEAALGRILSPRRSPQESPSRYSPEKNPE